MLIDEFLSNCEETFEKLFLKFAKKYKLIKAFDFEVPEGPQANGVKTFLEKQENQ